MGKTSLAPTTLLAALLVLVAGILASVGAQDAGTPAATGAMEDTTPRPAHIHAGTCDELGEVVYPLADVADVIIAGSPVPSPVVENPDSPEIVQGEHVIESITEVDVRLEELLANPHAVNVHESAESIDAYIACADITGEVDDEGRLTVEMHELNSSGWQGSAVLEQTDPGVTTVTITLQDTGEGAMGTPDA